MNDDEFEEIVIDLDEMDDEAEEEDDWDDELSFLGIGRTEAEREELRQQFRREQVEHDAITPTEWMGTWMQPWDQELRLNGRKLTIPMVVQVWIAGMERWSAYHGAGLRPGRVKQWSQGSKFPTELPLVFGHLCPFGHRLPDESDYAPLRWIVRDSGYVKLWSVEKVTCTQCFPELVEGFLTTCTRCEAGEESELHKAGHPRFEHYRRFISASMHGPEVYGDTSPFAFVLAEITEMYLLARAERIVAQAEPGADLHYELGIIGRHANSKTKPREITTGTAPKHREVWTDESAIAWLLANGVTPEMSGQAAWRVAGPIPGRPPRARVFAVQPRPSAP